MNEAIENYSTVEKIYTAFTDGILTSREAVDEFAKKQTQKPWHTKEWRTIREQRIKDTCKQCGTAEPPMVLQHLWHPDKLSRTIQDITRTREYEYSKILPYPTLEPPTPEDVRDGCPGCGKFSGFNWRKTHENWRCVHCHAVFDELVKIPVLSNAQYDTYTNELNELKQHWYDVFWAENEDTVLSKALAIGYEQHKRYISCVDTVTFCKKCAYMWDTNKKKMCEKCRHWIPNYMTSDSCFNCLEDQYGFAKEVNRLYAMYDDKKTAKE